MSAPVFDIRDIQLTERQVTLRLPFKFGVVTLTEAPQVFVRATIALPDGREAAGMAGELMVPKWFDKSPDLSNEDNFTQLRQALRNARDAYLATSGDHSAFGYAAANYEDLVHRQADTGLNPLAASFGPAQLDKAVLDALCRALDLSFADALRANVPGLETNTLATDLAGFDLAAFLASLNTPRTIEARHTVGMLDPLTAADQDAAARVGDGLPETLEEVIAAYGHRYFKIKVRGDIAADLDRLRAVDAVLERQCPDYRITLDGNEQFDDVEGALALWAAIAAAPGLETFAARTLFIEQPIKRAAALGRDVRDLAAHRPVIIDESDGDLDAFPSAKALGYTGVSSKACKGFYKSILNAARCRRWNDELGADRYFLSAEDLTCQSGLAVQQDLALVATLGIAHVERNGNHYVNGMAGASAGEQAAFLLAHPDLYRSVEGRTCLKIEKGVLDLGTLNEPGFASAVLPAFT